MRRGNGGGSCNCREEVVEMADNKRHRLTAVVSLFAFCVCNDVNNIV